MSFDPQSPSDCADMELDKALVCEWCDEEIDQIDLNVEAFEVMDGACCRACFEDWGPK
ncbi:MAG: hypothetical protein WCO83_02355 [Alphaproteobacteria bacterium]